MTVLEEVSHQAFCGHNFSGGHFKGATQQEKGLVLIQIDYLQVTVLHHPLPFLEGALCLFLWAAGWGSTDPVLLSQEAAAVGECCAYVLPAVLRHAHMPGKGRKVLCITFPCPFSFCTLRV